MKHCCLMLLLWSAPLAAQATVAEAILQAKFTPTRDEVFGHVRFLAADELAGRKSGSPQGAIASVYVAAEFAKLGLEPAGDDKGFAQPFERMELVQKEAPGADGRLAFEGQKRTCRNLLAWLPGSDPKLQAEYVLVGAHYDHLGRRGDDTFHGADDNASGIAGMLAVARALVQGEAKPRRSVLFAAFDAEEQGLIGSEYFARHPTRPLAQCVAMINLDMIGRPRLLDRKQLTMPKRLVGIPDAPAVGVLGTAQSPELDRLARAVFGAAKLPLFAPQDFGILAKVIEEQAAGRSDHAPFERRKIPFLHFSTSENDDYHQPTDTIDKVDPETVWRIAQCIYRLVLAVDALEGRPSFQAGEGEAPKDGGKKGG